MSVRTTADEHMQQARECVEKAREEVGAVLLCRKTMHGADDFRDGHVRDVFARIDALSLVMDGKDAP